MWECAVCYHNNQDSATVCLSCHAPAPAPKAPAAPTRWQVECPVCGTAYPVDGPSGRVERCGHCADMFDQVRIASCAPEPVASHAPAVTPASAPAKTRKALLLRPARRPQGQGAVDITVPGEAILGRQGDCLPDEFCYSGLVSRRHCRVWRTVEGWMIEDLSSPHHTKVNGRRVPPYTPMPLPDRFFLEIADLCFNASEVNLLVEESGP